MAELRCTLGLYEKPKWNAARNTGREEWGDETAVKRSRRTQLLGGWKKMFTSQMGDKKAV